MHIFCKCFNTVQVQAIVINDKHTRIHIKKIPLTITIKIPAILINSQ